MSKVKRGLIIVISVIVIAILFFVIRQIYINCKLEEIDVTHEGIIFTQNSETLENGTAKQVTVSVKGTIDERYINVVEGSETEGFMENSDKVFEGTVTIDGDVFEMGIDKANSMSICQFENGLLQIMCSNNEVDSENWFIIYAKDISFDEMVIIGMDKPIEHKYSDYIIVAPAKDEESAQTMYDEMIKKLNK